MATDPAEHIGALTVPSVQDAFSFSSSDDAPQSSADAVDAAVESSADAVDAAVHAAPAGLIVFRLIKVTHR